MSDIDGMARIIANQISSMQALKAALEIAAARIEELEAALREIAEGGLEVCLNMRAIARAALAPEQDK